MNSGSSYTLFNVVTTAKGIGDIARECPPKASSGFKLLQRQDAADDCSCGKALLMLLGSGIVDSSGLSHDKSFRVDDMDLKL
ncbi:hypothetical protein Tco_0304551 [Tanacetum coccineum]